jgi:hypothetical protein
MWLSLFQHLPHCCHCCCCFCVGAGASAQVDVTVSCSASTWPTGSFEVTLTASQGEGDCLTSESTAATTSVIQPPTDVIATTGVCPSDEQIQLVSSLVPADGSYFFTSLFAPDPFFSEGLCEGKVQAAVKAELGHAAHPKLRPFVLTELTAVVAAAVCRNFWPWP